MAAEASRQIISIEINYQVPNLPNLGLQSIRVHCHFDSGGGRVFELYIIVQNGLHKVESPEFLNFVNHELRGDTIVILLGGVAECGDCTFIGILADLYCLCSSI